MNDKLKHTRPPDGSTPYDIWEPPLGHERRFAIKLAKHQEAKRRQRIHLARERWTQWFVAASLLFFAAVWWWTRPTALAPIEKQTAGLWQKMENTGHEWKKILLEDLRTAGIENEPEARQLIDDTYRHWQKMQQDLETLRRQYERQPQPRLLDAMILNLQKQEELLQDLRHNLDELRNRKMHENQTYQS